MFKNIVFRILAAVVLLAAIAGIAGFAFNAGMLRGEAITVQAPTNGVQPVPGYAYPMPFMHPFLGFGFLGLLVPLFLLFLAFGAFRRMLWGPRWGMMHHMHSMDMHSMNMHSMQHGPWGEHNSDFVPPMFAELHRRAHAAPEKSEDNASQKQS